MTTVLSPGSRVSKIGERKLRGETFGVVMPESPESNNGYVYIVSTTDQKHHL